MSFISPFIFVWMCVWEGSLLIYSVCPRFKITLLDIFHVFLCCDLCQRRRSVKITLRDQEFTTTASLKRKLDCVHACVSLSIEVRDVSRLRHSFCLSSTPGILSLLSASLQPARAACSSRTVPQGVEFVGILWHRLGQPFLFGALLILSHFVQALSVPSNSHTPISVKDYILIPLRT